MRSVVNSTKSSWSEFAFQKFQNSLSETASMIASAQEQGRSSRKKLVEAFLQFRDSVPEEIKKAAASVLKSFQAEVDILTSRSQRAEDAFIEVYQRLAEMPDPSLALAEAESMSKQAQQVSDLKMENTRLRRSMEELKTELLSSKSNECLLRMAQARVIELEDAGMHAMEEHQKQLEEQLAEKGREVDLIIAEASTRTAEAEARINSLSEALKATQSQVFDLQSQLEQIESARSKELDILAIDLEKANEHIAVLQQESRQFNRHADNEWGNSTNSTTAETVQLLTRIEELESELDTKKREIANLITNLHVVETEQKDKMANLHSLLESTEASLLTAEKSVAFLQAELHAKSDYEIIKKELEFLRSIEFQQQTSEESSMVDEALEFRLRRKNEQLQNRIASISSQKDVMESKLGALEEANAIFTERETQQRVLIARLEEDLNRASMCHYWQRHNQLQEVADFVEDKERFKTASSLTGLLSGNEEWDKTTPLELSIVAIIQNQRDRLRERNRELEENLLAARRQVETTQTELEAIRQDNVKLYEKIRFVQTYSNSSVSSPNHDDAVLVRYSNAYETRLNPFKQFGQEERQRRYKALLPHEKFIHSLGRMIVNYRGARLATFVYALALHLLVFLVLYKLVTSTDPLCPSVSDLKNGRPSL